jgi:hypothetical protein
MLAHRPNASDLDRCSEHERLPPGEIELHGIFLSVKSQLRELAMPGCEPNQEERLSLFGILRSRLEAGFTH